MMAIRAIMMSLGLLLVFIATARAAPQVNYPLDAQLPPVAWVGELYTFQFASTTFQPDPDKLQYSLIGSPSWLSLNGRNRTLWGTPGPKDLGKATFSISAAGEAGAVTTMESTLLVSNDREPTANNNISQSLASAGLLLGPKTLTIAPSKPLDLKFPLDAFQDTSNSFSYHATLADHTPLPAWISFDAPSLHFAGTTPPLTSGPQSFDIILIAADRDGFALASLSFTLVVSNHQLSFRPMQETSSFTKGEHVSITDLRSQLFLDNNSVADGDVAVTSDIPSWLTFNDRTLEITGLPPAGLMSQDITVTAKDRYGDSAMKLISLIFKSVLFVQEIGTLNVTAGQRFEYKISRSIFATDDVSSSVDLGPLGRWLQFNPATFTIYGTVPEDYAPGDIEAKLSATSHDGKESDSQIFHFNIFGSGTNTYSGGGDSTTSVSPPSESGTIKGTHEAHSSSGRTAGIVIGSIFGALIALIIVLALARCLRRRKKNAKGYISPKGPRSPMKADISRPCPILREDDWESPDRTLEDVDKGESEVNSLERTPDHPPQLALDLEKGGHSASSSIAELEATGFEHSAFGFKDDAGPSHRPADSMRIPTEMARRESDRSYIPSKQRRRTTAVYRDSHRSSGLPLHRRLTGKGHGRHTYSPSQSSNNVSSFRKRLSTSSATSTSTSILNPGHSAFPQPSAARHTTQLTTPMDKRQSIRIVSSTCASLVDRSTLGGKSHRRNRSSVRNSVADERPIDQKRLSWIKKRASAQSPFFGAGTSRMSSSSYKSPPYSNESAPPAQPAPSPLSAARVATLPEDYDKENARSLPDSLRIRKPSQTPSVEPQPAVAGSLRKPPTQRSFTRHTTNIVSNDRVYKRYDRPGTAVPARPTTARRASTRESLRANELKASLNSLTGSKIYEDAEMSASQYSSEEEEIEEYSKQRDTITPSPYTLPPLNLNKSRSKRESRRENRRDSKPKPTSKRDPTPYSRALEHGGKENRSSTYSLEYSKVAAKAKGKTKVTSISTSPERPRTAIGHRPARHTRTQSRITARSSTQRQAQNRTSTLSRQTSNKSRHSRSNSTTKHGRDRSRTQSSAYPYFDSISLTNDNRKSHRASNLQSKDTEPSLFERDMSGNILNYGLEEDPTIEELASSSIGFRTSNGRMNSSARQSRLVQLTQTQKEKQKRDTTIGPRTPSRQLGDQHSVAQGLGLSLLGGSLGRSEETPGAESERGRERTPLSVLTDANGASPEHVRVGESRGKKVVSAMAEGEGKGSSRGRRTWGMGSWKAAMRGRYWEREREVESVTPERDDRESKAFL
ncbi:hypothetical protein BDV96DRAFT_404765 [Lophiotrema nucula]|uniref:Dystroglycan-type cadherin-like domain-containing protein n=1 Tax=Lophiotrema nucula TaxID=690887 RepID=A0A6A5ZF63_9PLEO|nr:hypothetical protein BDV96DRAFT_404765 [Lophiotrema nucula]